MCILKIYLVHANTLTGGLKTLHVQTEEKLIFRLIVRLLPLPFRKYRAVNFSFNFINKVI